jgi:POT family proton-dependent oligopeptide transporter
MFKNHPKGLIVAFFTNMGERFGFYTMMAILVLFLQARYGLDEASAGNYYSWFYFAIYALALIGGTLADITRKYKAVIFAGQVIMFAGYCLIAVPGISLGATMGALLVIALGNGFFKGNLQAVVGQMYDNEKYSKFRDNAFMIFYMGINIGAFFAPYVAMSVRNWWLKTNGFLHDGSLPSLCHNYLNGTLGDTTQLQTLANQVQIGGGQVTDLTSFATQYLDVFAKGYNIAFGIAAGAMIISLIVYLIFNKMLPSVQNSEKKAVEKKGGTSLAGTKTIVAALVSVAIMAAVGLIFHFTMHDIGFGLAIGLFVAFLALMFQISTKEERPRVAALSLVFIVVVFFWMSFHQNGLTLTYFARDYIAKEVDNVTYLFFNLLSIICVIATIVGAVLFFRKGRSAMKWTGAGLFVVGAAVCWYLTTTYKTTNPIGPEVFQSFNPLFIVALTPLIMGMFAWLEKKGIVLSTPKKIGFGMIIAALGFVIILLPSLGLPSPKSLGGDAVADAMRVSPYWLMSSYLILTISELFLSPMGLAFVSKVAPPRFQGLMQGGWLLATATGNKLLFVGSLMWGRIELYLLWAIFIVCCLLSALFIFSIMKRLEKVTK